MGLSLQNAELLLLVAAVVAMLARRFHVPYTVGLVLAGITLSFVPFLPKVELTKELIFTALLPPLIFEAAFYMRWKDLRRDLSVILVLATLGVIISAAITAVGLHYLAAWQWQSGLIFGALIAATDPVSVIATFKQAGVHGRLRLLVEAESLFNDGVAAVAFAVVVGFTAGRNFTPFNLGTVILSEVGGGVLCGTLVALFVLFLLGRTEDPLVEITLSTVAAYGSFLLAEQFHFSGVLATLTTGLMLGNFGLQSNLSSKSRESMEAFWQYAAFVANSLIFLLIGIHEAQQHFVSVWFTVTLAIVLVIVSRAFAVYPICFLFSWSELRVSLRHQHLLFWGGLRGALALALALALPPDTPQRAPILTASFAVVAFSIFVQGLTLTPMLRRFGEIPARNQ